MKKQAMIKELEDMKYTLMNRYAFIDLTFFNLSGFEWSLTDSQKTEVMEYIDKRFMSYRDTWIIPRIDFLLSELKKEGNQNDLIKFRRQLMGFGSMRYGKWRVKNECRTKTERI